MPLILLIGMTIAKKHINQCHFTHCTLLTSQITPVLKNMFIRIGLSTMISLLTLESVQSDCSQPKNSNKIDSNLEYPSTYF